MKRVLLALLVAVAIVYLATLTARNVVQALGTVPVPTLAPGP